MKRWNEYSHLPVFNCFAPELLPMHPAVSRFIIGNTENITSGSRSGLFGHRKKQDSVWGGRYEILMQERLQTGGALYFDEENHSRVGKRSQECDEPMFQGDLASLRCVPLSGKGG